MQVLYCVSIMQVFKNVAVDDSFAKLNCYQHCQLFLHQLNFQNFTFPLNLSVLQHLAVALSHSFYIAVFQSVTLHAASKLNHRHNKQKYTPFLSINMARYILEREGIPAV